MRYIELYVSICANEESAILKTCQWVSIGDIILYKYRTISITIFKGITVLCRVSASHALTITSHLATALTCCAVCGAVGKFIYDSLMFYFPRISLSPQWSPASSPPLLTSLLSRPIKTCALLSNLFGFCEIYCTTLQAKRFPSHFASRCTSESTLTF